MNMGIDQQVTSPFGGLATKVRELSCTDLVAMYRTKCGVDIRRHFGDLEHIAQYQCNATGLRFWRPSSLAGDEAFYVALSQNWPKFIMSVGARFVRFWANWPTKESFRGAPGRARL